VAATKATRVAQNFLGYDLIVGVDDETNLRSQLDELAVHLADNAEGDRWVGGGGWREYRR
jgi:hypothetical protein